MHYFYFVIEISTGGKASHVIIYQGGRVRKEPGCEDMNYVLDKYLSTLSVASWILFCRYKSEVL